MSPEVLKYEEVSDPALGDDEVLIHVAATSINPFDLKRRSGAMKKWLPLEFPAILGVDVSGTVEQCGRSVKKFGYGDNVFAHAERTYASHCVVKADTLAKVPDGLDVLDVAALPTVTSTQAGRPSLPVS
jgi:NADPH:quinone reductase-like Zn-dependent oxidoreductase